MKIEDPAIIPLSPKAVGTRLVDLLKEIVKTHLQLIELILGPSSKSREAGDGNQE